MRCPGALLDDLVTIVGGGTPSTKRPEYFRGRIPWISPKDMKVWNIVDSQERVTKEAIENSSTKLIDPNAVLVVTRSGVLKHTLPVAINRVPVTINQDLKALICGDRVFPDYLARAVQALSHKVLQAVRGTTADNVPTDVLRSLEIPLPTLVEQKTIARTLEQIDRLRRTHRYALEATSSMAASVFLELFGNPRVNSRSWEVRRLEELGDLDRGRSQHRPRNAPELLGGPYPLIQTGDVANSNGHIQTFKQTYSELGLAQSKLWPKGTLCITIAANIAKTGILLFDACFPDSVVGFTANAETNTEFIQAWFVFVQQHLERTAPESAQKNINLEILRDLRVPVPPKNLQDEFAKTVWKVERLRAIQREALRQTEHLFGSLLDEAFGLDQGTMDSAVLR